MARLRAALATFVGTRNYHNMTVRHTASDPRVMRYVMSFTCSEPFVLKNDSLPNGCEFVRLNVLGQSFIIYQIRKMIGAAILVASGRAPLAAMTSISQVSFLLLTVTIYALTINHAHNLTRSPYHL